MFSPPCCFVSMTDSFTDHDLSFYSSIHSGLDWSWPRPQKHSTTWTRITIPTNKNFTYIAAFLPIRISILFCSPFCFVSMTGSFTDHWEWPPLFQFLFLDIFVCILNHEELTSIYNCNKGTINHPNEWKWHKNCIFFDLINIVLHLQVFLPCTCNKYHYN